MKYLFTALLLAAFSAATAQDTTLKKLYVSLCGCTELGDPKHFFDETGKATPVTGCINKTIANNAALLSAAAQQKYGAAANDSFKVYVRSISNDLFKGLIYYCDNFIKIMDSTRFYDRYSGDRDYLVKLVARYNTADRKLNDNFFYHRGMAYTRLGDYKKALADADSAVVDKPKDTRSWEFKGWILEITHHYDAALAAYEKMVVVDIGQKGDRNAEFSLIRVLLTRKKQMEGVKE